MVSARTLFSERGFAEVPMQEIADTIGINKATLYHHFPSKEHLFAEVIKTEFARLRIGVVEVMKRPEPLRERVRHLALYYFGESTTNTLRLFSALTTHLSPEMKEITFRDSPPPWTGMIEYFHDEMAAGRMIDIPADVAASSLWGLITFQAMRLQYLPAPIPYELYADTIAEIFASGTVRFPAGGATKN